MMIMVHNCSSGTVAGVQGVVQAHLKSAEFAKPRSYLRTFHQEEKKKKDEKRSS